MVWLILIGIIIAYLLIGCIVTGLFFRYLGEGEISKQEPFYIYITIWPFVLLVLITNNIYHKGIVPLVLLIAGNKDA